MQFCKILCTLFLGSMILACTPKVAEETTKEVEEEKVVEQPVDENLSPCKNWVNAPNQDEAMNAHVIYRDFLRADEMDKAFSYWQTAYELAPAADGKRKTHYEDGIKFYHHYFEQADTEEAKEEALEEILILYAELEKCYETPAYVAGRKAFDYFYKYRNYKEDTEIFDLFTQAIDEYKGETPAFIINPFTSLLVDLMLDEKIVMEKAQKYEHWVRESIEFGLESCEGKGCEAWEIVESYAPARLEELEGVEYFYDCDYYVNKYYPEFEANQDDCEIVRTVHSRLKWGKCPESNPKMKAVAQVYNDKCRRDLTGPSVVRKAYTALQEGQYQKAVDLFEKAAEASDDTEKKAQYNLLVAKIYYAHLKRFPAARKYALQAASFRPDWGEPYLLIGNLYASSGPLCGPGRGWDSQVVTWPAIDKWQYAKQIDPSVTSKANSLIAKYSKYMPSVEDIFQRNRTEGESFYVGCWIQESTTIRAAPR